MSKQPTDVNEIFKKLNHEYQTCLNTYYDKFLENKDDSKTDYSTICSEILNKLKETGDIYNLMKKELNDYMLNNQSKV